MIRNPFKEDNCFSIYFWLHNITNDQETQNLPRAGNEHDVIIISSQYHEEYQKLVDEKMFKHYFTDGVL